MTQTSKIDAAPPARAPWWASPYLQGFMSMVVLCTIGAALAGFYGLYPEISPLLVNVQAQSLLLMVASLWVVLHSLEHIVSQTQAELGIWFPIKAALSLGLLIPIHDNMSVVSSLIMTSLTWGASMA